MKNVLVTGCAGFIGFHLSQKLLREGYTVIGIDNLNNYYEVSLKESRLALIKGHPNFSFSKVCLTEAEKIDQLFAKHGFSIVVNLAAQAGVRYSLENPRAYIDSNIVGFLNILEACRHHKVEHLIYASSSSVYGANTKMPFSVSDVVDHPVSLYAATKKSNELMAHTYSHLYRIPTTGLRFFTVYGPWGRPDMALFLFTKAILAGNPIKVFNHGNMQRDFTYIDDIVEGIYRLVHKIPQGVNSVPYKIYNIGNNRPVALLELIAILEQELGRRAITELLPLQPGDVPATFAEIDDIMQDAGFKPKTSIQEGVSKFVSWYRKHYGV